MLATNKIPIPDNYCNLVSISFWGIGRVVKSLSTKALRDLRQADEVDKFQKNLWFLVKISFNRERVCFR
jgi:hypothetical protein